MEIYEIQSPEELPELLGRLRPGDCLRSESFGRLVKSARELTDLAQALSEREAGLISAAEGVDTRTDGGGFFRICAGLNALGASRRREGIARAKEGGRYKGRKPIAVDEKLFEAVAERWEKGEITAREAMDHLKLKPNTFYRRIKEREEHKMKEYKQVENELRAELREGNRQAKEAMSDLKKHVEAEAKEFKKAASEAIDIHDVKREMRMDRIRAKIDHQDEVRQMKKDVEAEAREFKKLLEGQE